MFSDRRVKTSLIAIATDLFLSAFKFALAFATGSMALKADAFHSATDFVVSLLLLMGILAKIVHEKKSVELKSHVVSMIEPCLAILVALIILYVPYEIISDISKSSVTEIDNLAVGIVGIVIVIFILLFISRFKRHVAKETKSIALEADSYHSMVDVFTSIAVLVSLIGFLVGINLDKMVAVVIAIMISITGIELLVSGIKALVKKSEFDQLSFYDAVADIWSKLAGRYHAVDSLKNYTGKVYKYKYLVLFLLFLSYLSTGLRTIPDTQVGKSYQFGRVLSSSLPPGLHYVLPRPFGDLKQYESGLLNQIDIGTRAEDMALGEQWIWQERKKRDILQESAEYYFTSDGQLIDVSLAIFYRVENLASVSASLVSYERVIKEISNVALNQLILNRSLEQLHSVSRDRIIQDYKKNLTRSIHGIAKDIHIVDVQILSFRPPSPVIGAYRDVINAQQEKVQAINRAVADRLQALPLAKASYDESVTRAESAGLDLVFRAEGEIERVSHLAGVQSSKREAFQFNAYIQMLEQALIEKETIIKDSALSNSDIRVWYEGERQ